MGRKRSKYYIDPDKLNNEIKKYNENGLISEKLGEMLLKLAKRYALQPNFVRYSYNDDFIGDAVCRMIEQLDKINLNHPNCNSFAYLTQICKNAFKARINKEKKVQYTKETLKNYYFNELELIEKIIYKKNSEYNE